MTLHFGDMYEFLFYKSVKNMKIPIRIKGIQKIYPTANNSFLSNLRDVPTYYRHKIVYSSIWPEENTIRTVYIMYKLWM